MSSVICSNNESNTEYFADAPAPLAEESGLTESILGIDRD